MYHSYIVYRPYIVYLSIHQEISRSGKITDEGYVGVCVPFFQLFDYYWSLLFVNG